MKRDLFDTLLTHSQQREHTILVGARQTGKSTLLRQLADAMQPSQPNLVLLNLERRPILNDLNENPEAIFRYLPGGSDNQRAVVLLDEVQYLTDPAHFLKLLYDEHADRLKIVATGSSAFYIDRQFSDSLAGRKRVFRLPTLSFSEFLRFRNADSLARELEIWHTQPTYRSPQNDQLRVFLDEYLTYGGYPAVVLEPDPLEKVARLAEIRDSFVSRDIADAGIAIRDQTRFYQLMQLVASQTGSLLNSNELATTLRLNHATVEQYLYVLQTCFHISLLRPFFQNLRKELTKMPKVYFNDFGLRNSLLNYFALPAERSDRGNLLENYVYRRLSDRYPAEQLNFWRTADGNEVDFVVREGTMGGQSIDVKFAAGQIRPAQYRKFTEAYPLFPLRFVSYTEPEAGLWEL